MESVGQRKTRPPRWAVDSPELPRGKGRRGGAAKPAASRGTAPAPPPPAPPATRWAAHEKKITHLISKYQFATQYIEAWQADHGAEGGRASERCGPPADIWKSKRAAVEAKRAIRAQLEAIDAESAAHDKYCSLPGKGPSSSIAANKRAGVPLRTLFEGESSGAPTPAAADGSGESGIEAEEIACSACGSLEADDDNDILMCDYAGCGLAYHQACVDPPVPVMPPPEEDWICPRCVCLLRAVMVINEAFETSFERWDEVFPPAALAEEAEDLDVAYEAWRIRDDARLAGLRRKGDAASSSSAAAAATGEASGEAAGRSASARLGLQSPYPQSRPARKQAKGASSSGGAAAVPDASSGGEEDGVAAPPPAKRRKLDADDEGSGSAGEGEDDEEAAAAAAASDGPSGAGRPKRAAATAASLLIRHEVTKAERRAAAAAAAAAAVAAEEPAAAAAAAAVVTPPAAQHGPAAAAAAATAASSTLAAAAAAIAAAPLTSNASPVLFGVRKRVRGVDLSPERMEAAVALAAAAPALVEAARQHPGMPLRPLLDEILAGGSRSVGAPHGDAAGVTFQAAPVPLLAAPPNLGGGGASSSSSSSRPLTSAGAAASDDEDEEDEDEDELFAPSEEDDDSDDDDDSDLDDDDDDDDDDNDTEGDDNDQDGEEEEDEDGTLSSGHASDDASSSSGGQRPYSLRRRRGGIDYAALNEAMFGDLDAAAAAAAAAAEGEEDGGRRAAALAKQLAMLDDEEEWTGAPSPRKGGGAGKGGRKQTKKKGGSSAAAAADNDDDEATDA